MIFLRRIELQGFKSFASKEVFDFNSRAVGVVGPNGSGKSNIVDAVRWVLGERGAKNLRGEVFENLIFAGTPKKSPASLARVSMTFDNRSGYLPVDHEEVAITRRIDRSGSSQFFINDNDVRLADVTAMLAKAKLGSRGLTIISQGQADVFVSAGAEERRMLIEEILGLKEYRIKKKSAERRLERSEENIRTLRAKIEEITPHLKFLRRQKNKWEKRAEVEKDLRETATFYFSHHYPKVRKKIKDQEEELKKLGGERRIKLDGVKNLEEKVKSVPVAGQHNKELKTLREEIGIAEKERSGLYKRLAREEARLEVLSENKKDKNEKEYSASYLLSLIRSFLNDLDSLGRDDFLENKFNHWTEKFSDLFKKEENNPAEEELLENKEIKRLKSEIQSLDNKIKELHSKEAGLVDAQSEENVEFRRRVEDLDKEKDGLRDLDKKIQSLEMKKEREEFRLRELEQKWASFEYPMEELSGLAKNEGEDGGEGVNGDWDAVLRKMDKLRSSIVAAGEIDPSLIGEAKETENRYENLVKELNDVEKAAVDLKNLINDLDGRIHREFKSAFSDINKSFNDHFRLMFGGGKARMFLEKASSGQADEGEESGDVDIMDEEREKEAGVEIKLDLPRKKIKSLEMLSGGEKSLVSIAALFALVSVSPPPFLVLDEVDAALDEVNSKRFADLIKKFSETTQFLIITHNRVTMEALDTLYGITMGDDGVSKVLSLKLEEAEELASKDVH